MVLYTILPLEVVFSETPDAAGEKFVTATVQGRTALVRQDAHGNRRLERLLSTDPADYLEPRFQPGQPV